VSLISDINDIVYENIPINIPDGFEPEDILIDPSSKRISKSDLDTYNSMAKDIILKVLETIGDEEDIAKL